MRSARQTDYGGTGGGLIFLNIYRGTAK